MCRPKHVEQLRNIGIINSTTRLHLVGSFCEIYIAMQGSMNITLYKWFTVEHFKRKPVTGPMVIEDVSFFNEKHTFSESSNKEYSVRT